MNGTLRLAAPAGEHGGACFVLTLPVAAAAGRPGVGGDVIAAS